MAPNDWVGRTVGDRYRIEELLGQGGMSAVYRATDPNLRRTVAVKVIHPHLSNNEEFVRRFEEEAAAVAQLRHPNIIQVYDFDHDHGVYYMVMEFIAGESLMQRMNRLKKAGRRLPYLDALRYGIHLCDAIDYAHKRSMIHRDIKPANVMLDINGQAILMDFGIAKILGGQQHTATGAVIGTALYMSPEQIRSERFDHRTDIYSSGVTLFEMIAGRPPFEAEAAMTLMMMHLNNPVPDLRKLRPGVPEDMVRIVERAMAKAPGDRFHSAAEMAAALRRTLIALGGSVQATGTTGGLVQHQDSMARSFVSPAVAAPGAEPGGPFAGNPGALRPPPISSGAKAPVRRRGLLAAGCTTILLAAVCLFGGGAVLYNQLFVPAEVDYAATQVVFAATQTSVMETRLALTPVSVPTAEPSNTPAPPDPPPTGLPGSESTLVSSELAPTPIPPGVPFVQIISVAIEGDHYRVEYETVGFIESPAGRHIHFYYDNINPQDAGFPGPGPWFMHAGPRPFRDARVADRPPQARRICALAAEPDHRTLPDSGNCIALPAGL